MRMRMTSDDPECIVRHFNIFFAENGKGYVRSGGADNQDIEEMTWIREAAKNIGAELCSEDDEGLCDELYDNLQSKEMCLEAELWNDAYKTREEAEKALEEMEKNENG